MHENEDFGFEDFEDALFDGDYQTDTEEAIEETDVTETEESTQEPSSDGDEGADSDDSTEGDNNDPEEEKPAEGDAEAENGNTNADQTFTLKVNKLISKNTHIRNK